MTIIFHDLPVILLPRMVIRESPKLPMLRSISLSKLAGRKFQMPFPPILSDWTSQADRRGIQGIIRRGA
jgi:hypothetical protein